MRDYFLPGDKVNIIGDSMTYTFIKLEGNKCKLTSREFPKVKLWVSMSRVRRINS
mgnify:CR=1 FL=1